MQSVYSMMKTGEFVMKGTDRKARLDERHKQIATAAKSKPDDDDDDNDNDDEDETEKEKLECETRELES